MPVLAGQTLLHYQLVDKIGAGGMGEVFPGNDPYREQPRFHAALRSMGLDWPIDR